MQGNDNHVMAMYDVRGIQNYIFRTSKMKEAVGASAIVEKIIEEALKDSLTKKADIKYELEWCTDEGPITYEHTQSEDKDVVVLYIGGGNAYVMYKSRELAVEVSGKMALYVLQKTYSLQLATAFVDMTKKYADDYKNLIDEMARIKDRMTVSKPIGALPVMRTEVKTGYPMGKEGISEEARLKKNAGEEVRKNLQLGEKEFDNYVFEKGDDSMLAVVHIDGNNMGIRIRKIIENENSYENAINLMRRISFNINASYKNVFYMMQETFNDLREEEKKWNVMKVIVSGDDITYVCNAGIALATVEYFVSNITELFMFTYDLPEVDEEYRFSVCAGISYFRSHFPFYVAYSVAEACCDNAKKRAKEACNMEGDKVGNWMDFQFCRNIKAVNLKRVRKEEYFTARGENLLRRPYYIPGKEKENSETFKKLCDESLYSYEQFIKDCDILVEKEGGIPRSFLKALRNTYPLGEEQVNLLEHFLKSRKRELPELYFDGEDGVRTAMLYDVLEVADYFLSFDEICRRYHLDGENENEKVYIKNRTTQ